MWHLGCVYSACLAKLGHRVTGIDTEPIVINNLKKNQSPIFEPRLEELIKDQSQKGKLEFSNSISDLGKSEIIFITFDTVVDENDIADHLSVVSQIKESLKHLKDNAIVIISSQLPVGTISDLENFSHFEFPNKKIKFCCLPENLRLGDAINVFMQPDRILIGRRKEDQIDQTIEEIFKKLKTRLIFMKTESAEVSKHAINAFLATSVCFGNEIASVCENVGADSHEVTLALKSESRIGNKAYIAPGMAFSGGTLARDIVYLNKISDSKRIFNPLIKSVIESNNHHSSWVLSKIEKYSKKNDYKNILLFGITYKANTDTLRRSQPVMICNELISKGFRVNVFDEYVSKSNISMMIPGAIYQNNLNLVKNNLVDVIIIFNKSKALNDLSHLLKIENNNEILIIDPNGVIIELHRKKILKNYVAVGYEQNE